jgi:hypothetical protein
MKNLITCSNSGCGTQFSVNTFPATQMPMMKEGVITCPHCLHHSPGAAGIIYISHGLPVEAERATRSMGRAAR